MHDLETRKPQVQEDAVERVDGRSARIVELDDALARGLDPGDGGVCELRRRQARRVVARGDIEGPQA
jgi:hypothetical protein